jgi:hypothetical protein
VGDITAGLPPRDYVNYPYVEWYGRENGRVVLELGPDEVEVIGQPIPWQQSEPVDSEKTNELLTNYLAGVVNALQDPGGKPVAVILARFRPGNIRFTEGLKQAFTFDEVMEGLRRHLSGDWGEIGDRDRRLNDNALREGGPLISSYKVRESERFFIVTMPDRSKTVALVPGECLSTLLGGG